MSRFQRRPSCHTGTCRADHRYVFWISRLLGAVVPGTRTAAAPVRPRLSARNSVQYLPQGNGEATDDVDTTRPASRARHGPAKHTHLPHCGCLSGQAWRDDSYVPSLCVTWTVSTREASVTSQVKPMCHLSGEARQMSSIGSCEDFLCGIKTALTGRSRRRTRAGPAARRTAPLLRGGVGGSSPPDGARHEEAPGRRE
jgi:hypothetical protein